MSRSVLLCNCLRGAGVRGWETERGRGNPAFSVRILSAPLHSNLITFCPAALPVNMRWESILFAGWVASCTSSLPALACPALSQVNKFAQNTDAQQLSRNLLLVPRATVNVKPNLQIIADDVKCTHGCAVSDLQEEELFYFRCDGGGVWKAEKGVARGRAVWVVASRRNGPVSGAMKGEEGGSRKRFSCAFLNVCNTVVKFHHELLSNQPCSFGAGPVELTPTPPAARWCRPSAPR